MESKFYRLNDDVIAQIARILQLALLTGTDLIDHLRNLKLEEIEDGQLSLTNAYMKYDKDMLDKLMETLSSVQDDVN